ncbi:hypothetical protein HY992_05335 [Candidatus Micrarchaeota archaeon]|nr:hypothetical protein [Candidatus Micrarchaeota archaeon]
MKHYPQYPAIKLARFGRDKKYEKQGVGKNVIIPWVVGYMKSLEHVAIRFITVDAYPNRVKYYEDLGFVPNQHEDYKRKENEQPTSMRLDLKMPCLKDVNSV